MYICKNEEKLKRYREKLIIKKIIPEESELPFIYVDSEGYNNVDLQAEYGTPYYDEIDINLINATNTSSSRDKIYSNYPRVTECFEYILDNKCRPINVLKDGDIYYIDNGKHRYLAHILLDKKIIPVSIREKVKSKMSNKIEEDKNSFIQYKKNLYDDDGKHNVNPEDVLEFYKEYKCLFEDINKIQMSKNQGKYKLVLTRNNQDTIEICNGISSGNNLRSSMVVMELIQKCGYDIDDTFIMTHSEFILVNKYDANNIEFNTKVLPSDVINEIKENISKFNHVDEKDKDNYNKLITLDAFIMKCECFNAQQTYLEYFGTGILNTLDCVYYIITREGSDKEKTYSYIFCQKDNSLSNLKTKYLGRIESKQISIRTSNKTNNFYYRRCAKNLGIQFGPLIKQVISTIVDFVALIKKR